MATMSSSAMPAKSVAIFRPGCDLLQADLRSLFRKCGMLAQTLDEKLFVPVHQRIVDGSSAKIHASHDFHGYVP